MTWLVRSVVAAGALSIAAASVWFLGMRRKWGPVLDAQRRINRALMNPRQLRTAGHPGAYAGVVHHVGRRTGTAHRTPVAPYPTDDGFVVALPYGTRPDWVRNVLAAGTARIEHEGRTFEVVEPRIVAATDAPVVFPASEVRAHRAFDVRHCLVVRRVD